MCIVFGLFYIKIIMSSTKSANLTSFQTPKIYSEPLKDLHIKVSIGKECLKKPALVFNSHFLNIIF
jgi:hypothetical protein